MRRGEAGEERSGGENAAEKDSRGRGTNERTNERYQNRKENSRKSDDGDELRGTAEENEKGGGTEDGRSVITCTTAERDKTEIATIVRRRSH